MPELPEVETVARGLRPLAGLRLRTLEIFDDRVWFESEAGPEALSGLRLREVSRRGKYLLLRFENNLTIVQHLRMTGKMLEAGSVIVPQPVAQARGLGGKGLQIRCEFLFENTGIWFFDTRRFGTITLVRDEERFFAKKKIAPDPILEPARALSWFLERVSRSGKPIKTALLDQAIVAGVGNIYADEALHAARIHPRTKASRAKDPRRLWAEILRILGESIKQGGSSIRDYVSAEGKAGSFAEAHLVYGRSGEPCPHCGTPISKITLGGRSTHFCAQCQSAKAGKGKSGRPKAARSSGKSRRGPSRRRSRS